MREEQIIYKNLGELIPYINNPRMNDDAVDAVASSIKHFGFKVPIVIDKDNEIINGHTRYKASKKLGLEEVPCIIADDLTETEKKAFRLADNKVSEIAQWDFELLNSELEEISFEIDDVDFDMEEFGFELNQPEETEITDATEELYSRELEEYDNVHFLITAKIKDKEEVEGILKRLGEINGVEIELSFERNRQWET